MRPSDLTRFKQKGQPIAVLTAWDSLSASLAEAAGADVVLIGDSLAMVALGHATTLPVSLDQMLHHTQAVARGLTAMPADQPLLVCDLPFLSYQCGEDRAVAAAGRLLKESSAAAVKLEGAEPEVVTVIDRLVRMGIPVMGHLASPHRPCIVWAIAVRPRMPSAKSACWIRRELWNRRAASLWCWNMSRRSWRARCNKP